MLKSTPEERRAPVASARFDVYAELRRRCWRPEQASEAAAICERVLRGRRAAIIRQAAKTGMPPKRLAELMGVSVSTVRKVLSAGGA
jgi:hypothetical protein